MPFGNAQSLTPDEVYAIVAYILYSNDMIDDDFVLSNETFLDVEMPNANGFIEDDRIATEHSKWVGEPCMNNCKDEVKVTMRAMVLDVTPQEEVAISGGKAAIEPASASEAQTVAVVTVDPALVAAGEKVFKKCKACHQVGAGAKNKSGPHLNGIVGRAAGSVDGFKYSKALKSHAEEGLVWDVDALNAFLAAPKKYMKGTRMSFAGVRKEKDLVALTAYLSSLKE